MDTATINGATLEYEQAGTGEPVLFIYGAFIADLFQPVLAQPSLDGYRRIHYHRRGYAGSSPATGPISVAAVAADCRGLLDHLGLDRAHVVGQSYGGAVALQLALDAPARVHSLALIEPALMAGTSAPAYRASLMNSAERYRAESAATVLDAFLQARSPGYRPLLDLTLPGAFAQAMADAATWFDFELPGFLAWRFSEEEARRVDLPVLSVLGGESEALWDRFGEIHRLLLAWLPRVEGIVLPGVAHLMQLQDPRAVAEALAAFWARHPMAPAGEQSSPPRRAGGEDYPSAG